MAMSKRKWQLLLESAAAIPEQILFHAQPPPLIVEASLARVNRELRARRLARKHCDPLCIRPRRGATAGHLEHFPVRQRRDVGKFFNELSIRGRNPPRFTLQIVQS